MLPTRFATNPARLPVFPAAKPSSASGGDAPAVVVPKRNNKLQRMFLDMEAELRCVPGACTLQPSTAGPQRLRCCRLPHRPSTTPACLRGVCSDEEGAAPGSEDEDEDVDDQGELVRGLSIRGCGSDGL